MAEHTNIKWCDHTFNPWEGCSRVSAECTNCYAETRDGRWHGGVHWGKNAERKPMSASYWRQPHKWDRAAAEAGERRRVFCASLADVFEDRPDLVDPRQRLWGSIHETPSLDWLLLTKRPENIERLTRSLLVTGCCGSTPEWAHTTGCLECGRDAIAILPSNVWLGATIGHQDSMQRVDDLADAAEELQATVTFLSCEPLLGPLDFETYGLDGIDWVICGGESGPNARPIDPQWVRDLRDQCAAAGVPFFFKQWGGKTADAGGHLLDGEVIQEFPTPRR